MRVNRQVLLVEERIGRRISGSDAGARANVTPREVPGCPLVQGRAEDEEGARDVRVRRRWLAAVEDLAGEVGVALGVPGDRRVAARLPVLPRGSKGAGCDGRGRSSPREAHRNRAVGPGPTTVQTERAVAVSVAAAVIVEGGDQVLRVVRVVRDRGLVLRLGATLQIRVGEVQTILIDLDVVSQVHGTTVVACREVGVRRVCVPLRWIDVRRYQRPGPDAGQQPLLDGQHLRVEARVRGDWSGRRLLK